MLAGIVRGFGAGNLPDSRSRGHRIVCKTLEFWRAFFVFQDADGEATPLIQKRRSVAFDIFNACNYNSEKC